jgi:hypothetical protein
VSAVVAVAALALLVPATGLAAPTILTNFNTGTDGWKVAQSLGAASSDPAWSSGGGNPAGFIRFADTDPPGDDQGGSFSITGTPFAGDRSSYYGDNLKFDLRVNGQALNSPIVYLFGNPPTGDSAVYARVSGAPGTDWTSFAIPLYSSDWKDPVGVLTKAAFKAILANLTSIVILADYQTASGEFTDLDNVSLTPFSGVTVNRSVSLEYSAHAFRGKLSSDDTTKCPVTNQVGAVMKRKRGDDLVMGLVSTNSTGNFVLAQAAKKGRFYALFSERHSPTVRCLAAKSPTVLRG